MSNVSCKSVKSVIWDAYLASQSEVAALAARVSQLEGELRLARNDRPAPVSAAASTVVCTKCNGTGQYGHLGACRACGGAGRMPVVANVGRLAKALVAVTGLGVKTQGSSVLVRRTEGWCVPTTEELEAAHASLSS